MEIQTVKKGAELVSVKLDGKERIHDGVNFWNRHSPILFPIVGQIKDGKTIIDDKEYQMGQHGFARDMEFEEVSKNEYVLKSSEETLKKYPYKFELYVKYVVQNNELKVQYKVKNVDSKKIFFGIGGHPAFNCDYTNEDCYLEYEKEENNIEIYQLTNGLINPEKCDISKFISGKKINLKKDIFDNDAIIMTNLNSNKIKLFEAGKESLEFDFSGFKYLAIWSKPGSSFVCIEPWFNTADYTNSDGIFSNKKDILSLEIGEEFKSEYKIKFN